MRDVTVLLLWRRWYVYSEFARSFFALPAACPVLSGSAVSVRRNAWKGSQLDLLVYWYWGPRYQGMWILSFSLWTLHKPLCVKPLCLTSLNLIYSATKWGMWGRCCFRSFPMQVSVYSFTLAIEQNRHRWVEMQTSDFSFCLSCTFFSLLEFSLYPTKQYSLYDYGVS